MVTLLGFLLPFILLAVIVLLIANKKARQTAKKSVMPIILLIIIGVMAWLIYGFFTGPKINARTRVMPAMIVEAKQTGKDKWMLPPYAPASTIEVKKGERYCIYHKERIYILTKSFYLWRREPPHSQDNIAKNGWITLWPEGDKELEVIIKKGECPS